MSRSSTRDSAKTEREKPLISATGIRDWIADVEVGRGQRFATFDTKVPKPKLPGSAASSAAKRLKKLHGSSIAKPETFWVTGMTGPLIDGEIERARIWGKDLTELLERIGADHRKRA